MSTGATPPVETPKDFGKGPQGEAARWLAEIDLFESEAKETFIRYEKIIKRYRNESWRDDIPAATYFLTGGTAGCSGTTLDMRAPDGSALPASLLPQLAIFHLP